MSDRADADNENFVYIPNEEMNFLTRIEEQLNILRLVIYNIAFLCPIIPG